MLDKIQLLILKDELDKDPLGKGYQGKDFFELLELLTFVQMISNPIAIKQIIYYNITNSSNSTISVTDFLNIIPITELLTIKTDPQGVGLIFYERLHALETKGAFLDVKHATIVDGVTYCYNQNLISIATKNKLIGTYLMDDPLWKKQVSTTSRIQDLNLDQITIDDLKLIKSL